MTKKIEVQCHTELFSSENSAIGIYNQLKNHYCDDQLFLLESLSGPEKDCNKSIIAFDPVVTVKVKDNKLTLFGDCDVVDFILYHHSLSGFRNNENSIKIHNGQELLHCLRAIESLFNITLSGRKTDISVGFFGYFGYDFSFLFEGMEKIIPRNEDYSQVHLTLYRGVIEIDLKNDLKLLSICNGPFFCGLDKDCIVKCIQRENNNDVDIFHNFTSNVYPSITRKKYEDWYLKAKSHIDIGDIYQIQLGHSIDIESEIPPIIVYQRLRHYNPSPYMYFFQSCEGVYVIGASPEMFVTLDALGNIVMRPIAGTIKNSHDLDIKEQNRNILLSDKKENAEHLMLVDLCRNDIARCSKPLALNVDELMVTEDYSHVIHLVSNVTGIIKPNLDKYDVMAATFPAGTMTGTPKIRAMELIECIEHSSRGIYAGCVGYFGFNNVTITALCIRTATYHNGKYNIRASGGIVEDSTASGEWNETINKLSSTYLAITNKELNNESFVN